MHYLDESNILIFLVQMFLLLLLTRSLGDLFRRWNQPALTAELLVGVLLGPTVLGRLFPELQQAIFPNDLIQQNMLETVAWIGVLFLLLESGLEMDFSVAWRRRGTATTIALSDIAIPMVVAFFPCLLLPERYLVPGGARWMFALFMATAMTISAMPVAARMLRDLGVLKSELGFLIMSALALNDIIGWTIFATVLGLFTQDTLHVMEVVVLLGGTVGFTAFALVAGRPFATAVVDHIIRAKLPEPSSSLTFVCLLGLLCGTITQLIGIHALFGFFIAGVVAGEARSLSEETRQIVSQMVYAIFVPIFFANIGLKIDLVAGFDPFLVVFVCVVGIGGRYLGAWIGCRLAGVPVAQRTVIAIAHTPGGMMEIVVALLALENGLITQEVFIAIVFGAVFSSVVLGPWMKSAVKPQRRMQLMEYLPASHVVETLSATTSADAVRELWPRATANFDDGLGGTVLESILLREQELGTALGKGIAVPHCRTELTTTPVILFGRSLAGMEWNAPDGQPVHFVFLLVTPDQMGLFHLQALAEIARILDDETVRAGLLEAADREDLHARLRTAFAGKPVEPIKA